MIFEFLLVLTLHFYSLTGNLHRGGHMRQIQGWILAAQTQAILISGFNTPPYAEFGAD